MEAQMGLALFIQKHRKEQRLTQEAFATAAGVAQATA
ncbi:MAG: DNA-binding XRE family transcriptional regulator, partial [Myxococcota bacterium]